MRASSIKQTCMCSTRRACRCCRNRRPPGGRLESANRGENVFPERGQFIPISERAIIDVVEAERRTQGAAFILLPEVDRQRLSLCVDESARLHAADCGGESVPPQWTAIARFLAPEPVVAGAGHPGPRNGSPDQREQLLGGHGRRRQCGRVERG